MGEHRKMKPKSTFTKQMNGKQNPESEWMEKRIKSVANAGFTTMAHVEGKGALSPLRSGHLQKTMDRYGLGGTVPECGLKVKCYGQRWK
jgi:hypothetical protein